MSPETIQLITNLITTVGFPIMCVIFMWRKITESDEKQNDLLAKLTLTIQELTDYIKRGEDDGK